MRWMIAVLALLVCTPRPAAAGQAADQHGMPPGTDDGPTLHFRGFMDVNFAQTDAPKSPDGFALGQFVGHLTSSLGHKVSFFGEISFTAHDSTFTTEIERAIIRYDYNDHFKISAGRYHTPINYWNTAYHHGLWLQTTVSRPEMIAGGGTFQPVHFIGVMLEGNLTSPATGLGYNVGIGNGRGEILSRAGDAGDVNSNRAWVAKVFARPGSIAGFETGAAIYHDKVNVYDGEPVGELIASAYIALARETPELIAEFSHVRHHDEVSGVEYGNYAYYVQAASRLRWADWKPYTRIERLSGEAGDPLLGERRTTIGSLGVRYELSDLSALKAEYRHTRRLGDPGVNGVYFQAAFTF
jgi:hypothetical protein